MPCYSFIEFSKDKEKEVNRYPGVNNLIKFYS